jgi:tetratricopeptide (TPR) repeat protein
MKIKTNPYIAGNPVGGGDAFIGRADVLRDVLSVLENPHENGIVLYGQRRIGKTSVLQELLANLPQKGPYAPVYLDLQYKAALPLKRVLQDIADRIFYKLDIPPPHSEDDQVLKSPEKDDFLSYVLSRLPEETVLVLLFDEFDVLDSAGSEQAGLALFPYLHDLMSVDTKRAKFVFAIGRRPEDLSNLLLSLFRGVSSRHVSLLSREDTGDLVRLSEKNNSLKWTDEVVGQVYDLTGGHPYLTQQLCQVIWEKIYDGAPEDVPRVRSRDLEWAVPEAIKNAAASLEWLWDGLGPAERLVISALSQAPRIINQNELEKRLQESGVRILIGELQNAPVMLEEWELIQSEADGFRIRVEMLRRWIADRKPLERVRNEIDHIKPVADSLFQAARGLYSQGDKLKEAVQLLRQTLGINPNHLKANQLLAEILLARGELGEARKLLERLYEYHPVAARPRLIQTLLSQAEEEAEEYEQLSIYNSVLELEPNQPEAAAAYRKIWEKRGDIALENNEVDNALEAYKKAGATEKIEKLNKEFQLESLYQQAVTALRKGEKQKAQKLLLKILTIEPSYRKAAYYMNLAVNGVKIKRVNKKGISSVVILIVGILVAMVSVFTFLSSRGKLDRYSSEFRLQEKFIDESLEKLDAQEHIIDTFRGKIIAQQKTIENYAAKFEDQQKIIDGYASKIDAQERMIKETRDKIEAQKEVIANCLSIAEEQKKKLTEETQAEIEARQKIIEERNAKIADQEKRIKDAEAEAEALQKAIEESRDKMKSQQKVIEEYAAKLEAQQKLIEEMTQAYP